MNERASLIHGELNITSDLVDGKAVRMRLPCPPDSVLEQEIET